MLELRVRQAREREPSIAEKNPSAGDAWPWAAIDADTKLVPCWLIAQRTPKATRDFVASYSRKRYAKCSGHVRQRNRDALSAV